MRARRLGEPGSQVATHLAAIPSYPLGSFRLGDSVAAHLPSLPLGSFGDGPCRRSIDIFRNSMHHNGSMGSFGQTVSRAIWPFSRPIMPRYPLGSFGATPLASFRKTASPPHWLRLGMAHVGGVSTFFGTQCIITGQWVRLDKPFHGRSRPFSRPIMPRYPFFSFPRSSVGMPSATLRVVRADWQRAAERPGRHSHGGPWERV